MKKNILIGLLALMALFASEAGAATGDYVPNEVLVQYKVGVSVQARSALLSRVKANVKQQFSKFAVEQWRLPQGVSVDAAVKQLNADPNIAFAEPNYRRYPHVVVPNDLGFSQQWALQNIGQTINTVTGTANADMNVTTAWGTTKGSLNVIVAVIDDSVDINHPDLAANIWTNLGEILDGTDTDRNGFVDDVHGWDFKGHDNDPSADFGTSEGHGTSVAGCIGAVGNNSVGVSGVNQIVSIMPLKFAFDVASELAAMQYAINNNANIVNASFGGPQFSLAESGGVQLLQNAGILLVVAAGNNDTNNDFVSDYPSSLTNPNILAVAASDQNDALVTWSHYGAVSVDLAAPGVNIYTTDSVITPPFQLYTYRDGTSFSSPYVAGIAALVKAQNPTATFQEMKGRILANVTPQTGMRGFVAAGGTANAAAAVAAVTPQPVIVVRDATWVDGGNGWPDPNETANFDIQLENVWQAATGVSATLVSLSPNLTVLTANATYPNLATDAYASPVAPFSVQVAASATGHQVYKLRLNIKAAGYAVSRYYQIGLGNLQNGVLYNGTLMATAYDDFQEFHVDVPAGATNLTFATTSAQDVDLLINPLAVPQFDYKTYTSAGGVDSYTQVSVGGTGNELINVVAPTSTGYFVTVVSFNHGGSFPYTIRVNYTSPPVAAPASGGGGGGCVIQTQSPFDPIWMLLLGLPLLLSLRRKMQ